MKMFFRHVLSKLKRCPKKSSGAPLSSRLLYHFTSNSDDLISILKDGFQYRPLSESLPFTGFKASVFSFPGIVDHQYTFLGVCFCDIPEHAIQDHIGQYGSFGIGLTKSWGMRNGITPIRYTHYHTPDFDNDTFYTIKQSLSDLNRFGRFSLMFSKMMEDRGVQSAISNKEWDELPEKFKTLIEWMDVHMLNISRYTQSYLGLTRSYAGEWRNRKTQRVENRVFYDEREWRAIKVGNEQQNLLFSWDDVEIVVIDEKTDVKVFLGQLEKALGSEFKDKVVKKIKTSSELT